MLRIEMAGLHDLPGAYRTCLLTGEAGGDASARYRDPDLLGHVYVGPYLTRGEGMQRVVVDDLGVAGYLLSADDTAAFEAWAEEHWWPPLRRRYPLSGDAQRAAPSDGSRDAELIRLIHAPERSPAGLVASLPGAPPHRPRASVPAASASAVCSSRASWLTCARAACRACTSASTIGNANAMAFYRHLGFRDVATEPGGVLMGLTLSPSSVPVTRAAGPGPATGCRSAGRGP